MTTRLPIRQRAALVTALALLLGAISSFWFHRDAEGQSKESPPKKTKRLPGGAVTGYISGRDGKPIAGAEIINRRSSGEIRRTKTDVTGKFLLDDVDADRVVNQFVVRAKGFAPLRVEFEPGSAEKPAVLSISLEPGHRIKGRVIDEAGKPIAGVSVYYAHGDAPGEADLGGRLVTDAGGRFQSDSLPSSAVFTFHAKSYSEIHDAKLPVDGDQEVVVTMKPPGTIRARVVDAATGKPIPRFTVRVTFTADRQPGDPSGGLSSNLSDPGEDFASLHGKFALGDLIAGMPLQVSVTADGYRRQVVRRVIAQSAATAEQPDIRLAREDPAKLVTFRGSLVNHKGEPVRGAELRLLVATDRPMDREAFPFNWEMIESGQVDLVPVVLQFQRKTTGADGAFVFRDVPSDAEVELVYWGRGIAPGRFDRLESLTEKQRAHLVVQAKTPGRIAGRIDLKAFPEADWVVLSGAARYHQATLAKDRKSFVIEDVPPGRYHVLVYSFFRAERKLLGQRLVVVAEGEQAKILLGEGDQVKNKQLLPPASP